MRIEDSNLHNVSLCAPMMTEDQSEVLAFLASPSTHDGEAVERIETHASIVFLAGPRAFKLKRAVCYDYLDFSTQARRRAMCEAEVRINRRTAPELYRGVVPVTREADGSLALGGGGTPVEWLIEMRRFDQEALLDRLAARGALDLALMRPLASAIAAFHREAAPRHDHGGAAGMAWVIDGNAEAFASALAPVLDAAATRRLAAVQRQWLERVRTSLDARRRAGLVRQCHGDLHLRNIVLIDEVPTLFDGVEFNDEIACIDVLYDLAFLLMDLWRRGLSRHANAVWNGYVSETAEHDAVSILPLLLSCRAAVRAKTSATAAALQRGDEREQVLVALARDYLALAERLLQPPPAVLIAIGGLSGSGKSTLAEALAPAVGAVPGALVLRSDEVRKALCGVQPLTRLGPEGYTPEVSARVYDLLAERAAMVTRGGHAAIADAVHARPADRAAIARVALQAGVPFVGIWLDAPAAVLAARVQSRGLDPSDADALVVQRQVAGDIGAVDWHRVDASIGPERVLREVTAIVSSR
jgi:uncharacterized protein